MMRLSCSRPLIQVPVTSILLLGAACRTSVVSTRPLVADPGTAAMVDGIVYSLPRSEIVVSVQVTKQADGTFAVVMTPTWGVVADPAVRLAAEIEGAWFSDLHTTLTVNDKMLLTAANGKATSKITQTIDAIRLGAAAAAEGAGVSPLVAKADLKICGNPLAELGAAARGPAGRVIASYGGLGSQGLELLPFDSAPNWHLVLRRSLAHGVEADEAEVSAEPAIGREITGVFTRLPARRSVTLSLEWRPPKHDTEPARDLCNLALKAMAPTWEAAGLRTEFDSLGFVRSVVAGRTTIAGLAPEMSPIVAIPIEGRNFTTAETKLTLTDGMVTSNDSSRSSIAEGAVGAIVAIGKAAVQIPAELVQIRINQAGAEKSESEAEAARELQVDRQAAAERAAAAFRGAMDRVATANAALQAAITGGDAARIAEAKSALRAARARANAFAEIAGLEAPFPHEE